MRRVVLAALLLLLTAASWPSVGAAQKACARWVKLRLGLDVASVTCRLNFEHAYCTVRPRGLFAPTLYVDCLQEHLPDHYRCALVDVTIPLPPL